MPLKPYNRSKYMKARYKAGETLEAIAGDFTLSRQRVHQIVMKGEEPDMMRKLHLDARRRLRDEVLMETCPVCGTAFVNRTGYRKYATPECAAKARRMKADPEAKARRDRILIDYLMGDLQRDIAPREGVTPGYVSQVLLAIPNRDEVKAIHQSNKMKRHREQMRQVHMEVELGQ